MKTRHLFVLLLGLLTACTPPTPRGPWDGEYFYGGSLSDITLSINNPEFKQACVFQDIGVRINENFICSTAVKDDTLEVRFEGERFGEVGGIHKVGDVLLTLKKPKDQKNEYVVRWGSYVPFGDMSKAATYFKKSK